MKNCPRCQDAPVWHYARNVSRREKADHFALGGCAHALAFGKAFGIISDSVRSYHAAKWDELAEDMFNVMTAPRLNEKGETIAWTEIEREVFRARIFPRPKENT